MQKCALIGLAGVLFGCSQAPPHRAPPASSLALLRSLAGDWHGTYEWHGARSDRGDMDAQYYVTGNGTAVVENLIQRHLPVMTSVYHLDGADLRMTHFCGAGNQPRLRAIELDPEHQHLAFAFVDITNAAGPDAPHVHGFDLQLADADHLRLQFTFVGAGKESTELIELARKKGS